MSDEGKIASDYIRLVRNEAALIVLQKVSKLICGDGNLTSSDKSAFHKHIANAYEEYKKDELTKP